MNPVPLPRVSGVFATLLGSILVLGGPTGAAELKVLKTGLGSGTVTSSPAGITCGTVCQADFTDPTDPTVPVTLTATEDPGSTFAGWDLDLSSEPTTTADCTGASRTCRLSLADARSVRPKFDRPIASLTDLTPEGIRRYLMTPAGGNVRTAAAFLAALPDEFKQNWILMSRSESLQTGTATAPRILLPSADAKAVFTVGMTIHSSYPGAHPAAIEYMQWDAMQKNFRFHEIVLDTTTGAVPVRTRGVYDDDPKCFQCHSTRNVRNTSTYPGTTGITPGTVKFKNKPNWDTYDSWGGMLPFNRDRIYQGSVEAAAFRRIFDPWTWQADPSIRAIIEQLYLQPPGVLAADAITRLQGGANDGRVRFAFDPAVPLPVEPPPSSSGTGLEAPVDIAYAFDGVHRTTPTTRVTRGGSHVHLRHTTDLTSSGVNSEGRGVQLFDILGGADGECFGGTGPLCIGGVERPLNVQRIVDELASHRIATSDLAVDVRPIALAISQLDTDGLPCIRISAGAITTSDPTTFMITTPILDFLRARHGGMTIAQVVADTATRWSAASPGTPEVRSPSMTRRKADIQRFNLDRTNDFYIFGSENGLLQAYGSATTIAPGDTLLDRVRKEVFRRPNDLGVQDSTVMRDATRGYYVDRESYAYNTDRMALYRYFLEPLGVSVDKWSMGVRGRSRSYSFADVFPEYRRVFELDLTDSLTRRRIAGLSPPFSCSDLVGAINTGLASFPARASQVPTFTDVQRIFNKACIECHGGLGYPPYGAGYLDFSEDESPSATPPSPSPRLARSHSVADSRVTSSPATSRIYQKITETSQACSRGNIGLMPCGGPPLSRVDIETIRRWIVGPPSAAFTVGDPHLQTVDGVSYDFQSAGEFTLLRNESLEIQARQSAIATNGPLGANAHTGLVSCASLNSAAAVRVGRHRITYQPNLGGRPDPEGLELRVDGKLTPIGRQGIVLDAGGRITATSAPGGIQIEAPGGAVIVITPGWWDHYQVWYLNIDARHTRATAGVAGIIAPGSWLPALPDGRSLGPRPRDLHRRYVDLYERFEEAWRVTDTTSLFDYAPGTSSRTFTIHGWPEENPQQCIVPVAPHPGGPIEREPLERLSPEEAEEHCAAIVTEALRGHCVEDVMTTGEPGFAATYLRSEQIALNTPPTAPVLVFPQDNDVVTGRIDFAWSPAADADGDGVTYRHCLWPTTEQPDFGQCDAVPSVAVALGSEKRCAALVALVVALFLLLWLVRGSHKKRALLAVLVLVLLVAVLAALYLSGRGSLTKSVPELQAGKAYNWRVFAEDGNGGTTESMTVRFTVE